LQRRAKVAANPPLAQSKNRLWACRLIFIGGAGAELRISVATEKRMHMIIYSYHLVTSPERQADLQAALAALAADLASRPGVTSTTVLHRVDDPLTYRFEECWDSAEAHDASMDAALKALLKQVMAGVVEPVTTTRFQSAAQVG